MNAIELALATSSAIALHRYTSIFMSLDLCTIWMILPAVNVGVNTLYLTPKLVRRGKQVVFQHMKEHGGAASNRETNSPKFRALEEELMGVPFHKTDRWHIVYIVLELIKMISLIRWIEVLSNEINFLVVG